LLFPQFLSLCRYAEIHTVAVGKCFGNAAMLLGAGDKVGAVQIAYSHPTPTPKQPLLWWLNPLSPSKV
jgi:hypothetical protein